MPSTISPITCPNCQKEYTCVGQMLFCPSCKYEFEVIRIEPTQVTRITKEKKQPVWNLEKRGFDF